MAEFSDDDWAALQKGFGGIDSGDTDTAKVSAAANLELTRAHLIENAPYAAGQLVQLARFANNERVRLDASRYILDRTLGPVGAKMEGAKGPLQDLLEGLFDEAEAHANQEGE